MSDPRPIPRHFSQSGSKLSTKPSPKPKPKSEWALKLEMPNPGIDNNSRQSSATLSSLPSTLSSLQPGLRKVKARKIFYPKVEIPQAPIPMTSDDEDIPLSSICELIIDLPDLVKAQIMRYQRIAEQNRPVRRKINLEFQRILALQTMIVGDKYMWPLYPSFIKFVKKHFPLDQIEIHSTVIEMSETRRNVIGWMYQFERTFCKHPCIRSFNY